MNAGSKAKGRVQEVLGFFPGEGVIWIAISVLWVLVSFCFFVAKFFENFPGRVIPLPLGASMFALENDIALISSSQVSPIKLSSTKFRQTCKNVLVI